MLSRLFKYIFVLTSISPVFLAIGFGEFIKSGNPKDSLLWLILFIVLSFISWEIIKFSKSKLELLTIKIESIKPVDRKMFIFYYIVYILPIFVVIISNIQWALFFTVLFYFITLTNKYHLNPILSLFGYRHNIIKIEARYKNMKRYVLITRTSNKDIRKIVQITNSTLLEV